MTYQTEYDPTIGCNIPTDITFTPALFASLDISEEAVASARRSRVEWENRLRKKQGLDALGMDELIARAGVLCASVSAVIRQSAGSTV